MICASSYTRINLTLSFSIESPLQNLFEHSIYQIVKNDIEINNNLITFAKWRFYDLQNILNLLREH